MLNCLYITIIVTIIYNHTDFIDTVKSNITKWLTNGKLKNSEWELKPFTCPLCTSFWLSIIYLLITSRLSLLSIMIVLLLSISTDIISDIIRVVKDNIIKLLRKLE